MGRKASYIGVVPADLPAPLADWFTARGWAPRRHQRDMLAAARAGRHALLVAPTGAGKTLSGFLPTLADLIEAPAEGLHTLYISPLKALATDIRRNLEMPIAEMQLPVRAESRTGDTPQSRRLRQRERPPDLLMTTPESLALLLSYPDAEKFFDRKIGRLVELFARCEGIVKAADYIRWTRQSFRV